MEELAGAAGSRPRERKIGPGVGMTGGGDEHREVAAKTFAEYMAKRNGRGVDAITGTDEYREQFYAWMAATSRRTRRSAPEDVQQEIRALSKASAGAGLNLVPTSSATSSSTRSASSA
jgi:hypothetical protein